MKYIDKIALKIFSIIILILAVFSILLMTRILELQAVLKQLERVLDNGETTIKVLIGVLAVLMLLAIKGFFFTSKSQDSGKEGIVLENNSGKLVISKESLENLIASVVKDIPGADTVSSKTILDKNKNLIVFVTAVVSKDVMIKEISNELQEKIKIAMKKTADLDVKEVNIKIKNITTKKIKGLPSAPNEEMEQVTPKEEKIDITPKENNNQENKEE